MGTFSYPLDVEAYTSSLVTTTSNYCFNIEQGMTSYSLNDDETYAQDKLELKEKDFETGGEVEALMYVVGDLEDNFISFNEETQSIEFEKPLEDDVEVVLEVQRTEYKPISIEEENE